MVEQAKERLRSAIRFLTYFRLKVYLDVVNTDQDRHLRAGFEFKGWPPVVAAGLAIGLIYALVNK